jgi:hypothetical protein
LAAHTSFAARRQPKSRELDKGLASLAAPSTAPALLPLSSLKTEKTGLLARLTRMSENAKAREAAKLDKRADQQEDRAGKMARKHMRGGRRARKAMIAAESDRRKAERLRGK